MLSRKSELRRLKNDLTRLDQLVDSTESQFESLVTQIQSASDEMADVVSNRDGVNEQLGQARAEFDTQQQRLKHLAEQHSQTESELADNDALAEAARGELTECFNLLNSAEASEQDADNEIARLDGSMIEIEQERNQLVQAQTDARLKLARQTERRESLQADASRLTEEQTAQKEQLGEITRRVQSLDERQRQSELIVLNASAELAGLAIQAERSQTIVRAESRKKENLRDVRGELGAEENRIRQSRRAVAGGAHLARHVGARELRQVPPRLRRGAQRPQAAGVEHVGVR